MSKRNLLLIVILTMIAMTVAACGGGGDEGGDNGGGDAAGPEDVMRQVLESTFATDFETLATLVCEAQRAEIEDAAGAAGGDEMADALEGMEFDLSGLEFSSEIDGDTATVSVSGEMSLTMEVAGESITESAPIDEMGGEFSAATLVREDGEWKFCPETTEG